ncbi:hypothetical protein RND71_042384 [Anisodus tanguticus]|uniref:Uncharacterized protein n=1 Tax=Anisodus tanguticus TaxID=243964 RepID=A0AAE1UP32_9SOLA|nr:hypothetical protein RND71_042384 [Anisodus tanguticus]
MYFISRRDYGSAGLPTFYDDPDVSYTIRNTIKILDEKRRKWLKLHPSFTHGEKERPRMSLSPMDFFTQNSLNQH